MAVRTCPHCNVVANFKRQHTQGGTWARENAAVSIEHCDNCAGIVSIVHKGEAELHIFPTQIPTVNPSVYKPAANDFIEGVSCVNIQAYKAAATMFRRSLQQVMIDKKAKDGKLVDQIDDLKAKNVISADLSEWAHEIRLWGNLGAHPNDDGLDQMTVDDVVVAQTFMEALFEYSYILPASVAQSKAKRSGGKP